MMKTTNNLANLAELAMTLLLALSFTACEDDTPESIVDPLPLPSDLETGKDQSVDPGDSFYDYCNGEWLKSHPIPERVTVGSLYDAQGDMEQRVKELAANIPDIGHFYELIDNIHTKPEKVRAYVEARKADFPKPTTREEAFLTIGKMLMAGIAPWVSDFPSWNLQWKDGKLYGTLFPPKVTFNPFVDPPKELVSLTLTRADGKSAESMIVKGMGLDISQFVTDPSYASKWRELENRSLEELCRMIDNVWNSYVLFVSQELVDKAKATKALVIQHARVSLNYAMSYHLANRFFPPADKERYVRITKEIEESFRKRIQAVSWMSETTRNNALEKIENMRLYVAYPDKWYTDCLSTLTDCETLAEAVDRNNQDIARLKSHLLGGTDCFTNFIHQRMFVNGTPVPLDLTTVNAFYYPQYNAIFIFPAMLLPPVMPSNVSEACAYAAYMVIGHEITHGFDSDGAKYDKWGNKRNWWTVADQMAFEERQQNLIKCYNHLELDPNRAPGLYGDGKRTLTENIADLGGFLTALDAYKARLQQDGYSGETYQAQLRKFFEFFAYFWRVQYDVSTFENIKNENIHSHARLRVNGPVMNTDLWYQLYNVDRNNYLYLPTERRTYIW